MKDKEIFAIYFPSWHPDAHYEKWYGRGFSEWELLKTTRPLFEGHLQPKKPLWGYFDESAPEWMEKQIDTAADHGITGFLFDWYWYDGELFLEKPLNEAFLSAPNGKRLKFALMWANHDWGRWPALDDEHHAGMNGNANQSSTLFLKCVHSLEDCRRVAEYCCEKYFLRNNYWKIGGKAVFSFFATDKLREMLGSEEHVAEALRAMDEVAKRHGLAGIHFLANVGCCNDNSYFCGWGRVPGLKKIGFDSVFAYNIVAPTYYNELPDERPVFDYSGMMESQKFCWGKIEEGGLPHFPSVTLGLDVSPRWSRAVRFPMDYKKLGYCPVCTGNTPERFGEMLSAALEKETPAVILNAWNEWSEGMFLIPESRYGYEYLEAAAKAVKKAK